MLGRHPGVIGVGHGFGVKNGHAVATHHGEGVVRVANRGRILVHPNRQGTGAGGQQLGQAWDAAAGQKMGVKGDIV